MIKEWIQYLRSDAPSWARERGLIYESIALQARHARLKRSWEPHLQQTQDCVCEFLYKNKSAKRVLVLGSGPLLDFPKDFVEESGLSLTLVDAVHPHLVKRWAKKRNHSLRHVDLSLCAERLWTELVEDLESVDAIVSLNLMSQLPLSLPSSGKDHFRSCAEEHLRFLQMSHKPVLLISDFLRHKWERNASGAEVQATIPSMPHPIKQWKWELAPIGEIDRNFSIELSVGVWTDKQIRNCRTSEVGTLAHESFL